MPAIENPKIPWSGRGHKYTAEEIATVVQVMSDADPLTQGKYQSEFEECFRNYLDVRAAYAISSCSAALQLCALLTRIGEGDEVIIPAHTFAATAIPFARSGAKIIWADIDPETWVVTAEKIRDKITPRTRAVVIVHLYGLVADMDPIMKLAREHNFFVIEDVAQAPGAVYKDRKAGSIGDAACFSFHTHKNMTTLGEGGLLAVNREEWIPVVPGLRHHGMRPYSSKRDRYWIPAMANVDFDWEGVWPYKFCLSEVQCALGTRLLRRLDLMNEERQRRANQVTEALKEYPELVFQKVPEACGHVRHLLPARYDGARFGKTRDDLIYLLAFEYGVQAIVQYYPLYRYPLFQKAGFGLADCPQTDRFFDNMVSFPFHHWLSEEQTIYMTHSIRSSLNSLRTRA